MKAYQFEFYTNNKVSFTTEVHATFGRLGGEREREKGGREEGRGREGGRKGNFFQTFFRRHKIYRRVSLGACKEQLDNYSPPRDKYTVHCTLNTLSTSDSHCQL